MHIDLPIHQATADDELLNAVDTFDLHHQAVIAHVEHFQQSLAGNASFLHAREERVAAEIIHPVHVQLARDQLVQEMLRVLVLEDCDGYIQGFSVLGGLLFCKIFVDALHHQERYILVCHAIDDGMLEDMREGSVSDIVQEDRYHRAGLFLFGDCHTFLPERIDRLLHQVHRAQRVTETAVHRARIDQIGQA